MAAVSCSWNAGMVKEVVSVKSRAASSEISVRGKKMTMAAASVCKMAVSARAGARDAMDVKLQGSPFLGEALVGRAAESFGSADLKGRRGDLDQGVRRKRSEWKMEVADPLENYRDSFGNECTLERRARKELETNESYKKLVTALEDVRSQMQAMVAKELYEDAAQVRDTLNMLEFRKRLLELSAKPRVLYRVGDVVVHRRYGYRGVIYGHDLQCSAPRDWQEAMKIDLLPEGREQPFYHVLVDTRDRPGGVSTYVAQENLGLYKLGRPVLHSWIPKFFVGFQDGTYLPGPLLRRLYPNDW